MVMGVWPLLTNGYCPMLGISCYTTIGMMCVYHYSLCTSQHLLLAVFRHVLLDHFVPAGVYLFIFLHVTTGTSSELLTQHFLTEYVKNVK